MKSRILFIVIFLVSFTIGCVLVFSFLSSKTAFQNDQKSSTIFTETQNLVDISKQKNKTFKPEIFGLKDFTEDRFPPEIFKFVDVINHGNNYRESEVIAKNGENWLGFFYDGDNSYLQETQVEIVHKNEINRSDQKQVSIKFQKKNPLFIIKDAKKLKEGNATTLFSAKTLEEDESDYNFNKMDRGFLREYKLGDRIYTFQVKDALTKSGDEVLALVLTEGNVSQTITYGAYYDEYCLGYLLWVGDLDGDEKLDFYMEYENFEKGYFSSSLFLSSEAEKGELVKQVAGFGTSGC